MLNLKRTKEEIIDRIEKIKDHDIFGFETNDLVSFLPFEDAKQFCNEGYLDRVSKGEITYEQQTDPIKEIKDYMDFAWEKANNCRGNSAFRSICHLKAWLWLAGWSEQEVDALDNYSWYGKDKLVMICKKLGIDWKKYDDGNWRNNEYEDPITSFQAIGE